MRLHHQARSETGRRGNNEDAFLAAPELGFFAVADGMGGYEGGEVASRVALESLRAYVERAEAELGRDPESAAEQVRMAIRIADREVKRRSVGALARMGTTLASILVRGSHAVVAHVGDSRVYRLRGGELELLTRDHSLVAEMEAAGMGGSAHLCHIITRALGHGPDARPDVRAVDVRAGDRFLLCSDGLTDVLSDDDIAAGLSRARSAAASLVRAAYAQGSPDNITALVIRAR